MKLKNPTPTRYHLVDFGLPLEYEDAENPSWVEVRQSTTGDEMYLAELFAETTRVVNPETGAFVEEKRQFNGWKMVALRVFKTLANAGNIEIEDPLSPDSFAPAFTFSKANGVQRVNMCEEQFLDAWKRLPEPVSSAIYNAVVTKNEQWSNPK